MCPADYPYGIPFNELFKNEDFDNVSIHSLETFEESDNLDIVGFVGWFSWKNNKLTPLDGDSYSAEMDVYGFEKYDTIEDGIAHHNLTILVEEW